MTSSTITKTSRELHEKRLKALEEIASLQRTSTAIGFFPVVLTAATAWLVRGALSDEGIGLPWWASFGIALIFGGVMIVGVFAFFTRPKHAKLLIRRAEVVSSWEKTLRNHLREMGKTGEIEFQSDVFDPRCAVKHSMRSGVEYFSLVDDGSAMILRQ